METRMGSAGVMHAAVTSTFAVALAPPSDSGSVALIIELPALMPFTLNVALFCPAGIVALAPTVAMLVSDEVRVAVVLEGWAVVRFNVKVTLPPTGAACD